MTNNTDALALSASAQSEILKQHGQPKIDADPTRNILLTGVVAAEARIMAKLQDVAELVRASYQNLQSEIGWARNLADTAHMAKVLESREPYKPPSDDAWRATLQATINQQAEEIERLREAERRQWQPIETAPRDGTPVLLSREPGAWPFVAYWANPYRYVKGGGAWIGHESGLHEDRDGLVWMPLPSPPK